MSRQFHNPIAAHIAERLAAYLGAHTAQVAVQTCAQKALSREAETLTAFDVPKLCEALQPMLQTFIGRAWSEIVLASVIREIET